MRGESARRAALACAVALGVLGDWLLRAPGPPGLNLALLALAGSSAVVLVRGVPRLVGWRGSVLWVALLFAAAVAGRDAAALRILNLLCALSAALLATGAGGWLARAGLGDHLRAGLESLLRLLTGPVPLLPQGAAVVAARRRHRHLLAGLRGALLAIPPLFVFGSLLAAADPVFGELVTGALAFDPNEVVGHAAAIAVLSWLSAGWLGGWLAPAASPEPLRLPRPRVGLVEGGVALALLDALFLAFVAVQLHYLFGGAELVEITPGLGYAEYARRGFFELVTVAALVVPLLLAADWCVHRGRAVEEWVFRGLAWANVLLLFAILASALYRMQLYRDTYGLTELRLYATWFMGWIAFVLAWLTVTVLRGRRDRFAIGAFASALVVLFVLNLVNPHARIARVNAERGAAGGLFDAAYTAGLSGDAVPVVLASLDALPAEERCRVADRLLERWVPPRPGGWRAFNYGDWRARAAVRRDRSRLEALRCERAAGGSAPAG